ncbi:hypothetical protein A4X13_0g7691 [Tilletia indica]|uniref:Uncharacterized protein n=1 Tax=Tilletia indica TaxID=43049 RepID=A0A177T5J4_9BASI|nr:hypothetical protein A4X13_0g7691 [Tilletia indica]
MKASNEGKLPAELDNHLSATADLFSSIYTAASIRWRHQEFADHVPVESRSDRNRQIQSTFELITPTIAQACEALEVLLWRETFPNVQMSGNLLPDIHGTIAALSKALTPQPGINNPSLFPVRFRPSNKRLAQGSTELARAGGR